MEKALSIIYTASFCPFEAWKMYQTPKHMRSGYYRDDASQYSKDATFCERQNSEYQDRLYIKVNELKKASLGLGDIIRRDKSALDTMTDLFDSAGDMMRDAKRKFSIMKQNPGMNTVLYLSLFMFCVFLIFYFFFL